jgi:hypothetical protein
MRLRFISPSLDGYGLKLPEIETIFPSDRVCKVSLKNVINDLIDSPFNTECLSAKKLLIYCFHFD